MKTEFSSKWKSSVRPGKQRKYRAKAPLHVKHKMLSAHLGKDLRQKYKRRSFPVVEGDKVKVMRGQFAGVIGEIESVNLKKMKLFVKGVEFKGKTGAAPRKYPVDPSNLMLISLKLEDKARAKALERGHKPAGVAK